MLSSLDLMSEHPENVSGRTILITTKKIAYPSSWVLKVYAYLKALNFHLELVFK